MGGGNLEGEGVMVVWALKGKNCTPFPVWDEPQWQLLPHPHADDGGGVCV